MQSGLFYGYIALVDGLVERCREELVPGGTCKVVATGGFGSLLANESKTIEETDPNLTLTGLALLYERNPG
jgi:type III pantothenate kinase